ncbi:MAG: helix-turn-helix domain-containing protein [Dyadobacter sp.]|uniref:helix-turn-helix domain-containing protein n=1 Tax=Dyadobacter sp. TaxID=1914288 RepID=UPI0032656C7A
MNVNYHRARVFEKQPIKDDFQIVRVPGGDQGFSCLPYNQKGLFKISIHHGANRIYYADKVVEMKERAILFSRPNMVYHFEPLGEQYSGYICVFTEKFFDQFVNINDYPLFKPGVSPLTEISDSQMEAFVEVFEKMELEHGLDFTYKHDTIRVLVLQLILDTLKLRPNPDLRSRESNSAMRLSHHFKELLEGQFPILSPGYKMLLRHPAEFADALFVHVNHLNRSLKEVTEKTTSQLIADRIFLEAKLLLQNTDWNINEIAWCLGFEDLAHFIKFFKKNAGTTPSGMRKVLAV